MIKSKNSSKLSNKDTIYLVWIENLPIWRSVVQAKSDADAVNRSLNKCGLECTGIHRTNSINSNCRVNDNFYFITYK